MAPDTPAISTSSGVQFPAAISGSIHSMHATTRGRRSEAIAFSDMRCIRDLISAITGSASTSSD